MSREGIARTKSALTRKEPEPAMLKTREMDSFVYLLLEARNRFFCELFFSQRKAEELEMPKIFDANYGSVRTYPAEAWQEIYGVDLKELF